MPSEVVYDVVKTERVEGRDKPFYNNVGKVIRTERGYLKLHLPMFGWFELFEPRPRDDKPKPVPNCPQPEKDDPNDHIPF